MTVEAHIGGYRAFLVTDLSGGLNLRDKSDAVGEHEAVDLLNVNFTDRGAIQQRDGYDDFTPANLTNRVDSLSPYYNAAGVKQLIAGCGTRLEALTTAGAVVSAVSGMVRGPWSFVRFGSPGNEHLYAANGADTPRRWDGAAWTGPLATVDGTPGRAMPRAGALAVTAALPGTTSGSNAANRMIATAFGTQTTGGPNGAATNPSRVYFSNAGQPEFWDTITYLGSGTATPPYSDFRGANWMDLTPGDGESIQAAVTWRELVFIFKETKFFVLWGEGTASDGTATFQVREVVNSIGLASPQAVAVGRDGVYFFNRRGVYRTTGGDPALLSDAISPLWTQDPEVYFQSLPINLAHLELVRMLWHMERLYVAFPSGGAAANDRVLVYDTQHNWWSLYDLPASALASFRPADAPAVHFGYATGANRVGRLVAGRHVDRLSAPITSRWRSGWSDFGSSNERTFRETRVWGTGATIVSSTADFNQIAPSKRDTVLGLLGSWPVDGVGAWDTWIQGVGDLWPGGGQVASALVRYALRGFVFSIQFTNSPQSAHWSVHRVARHLREVREPSMR